jgi:RHS repeat-associated protein
MLLAWASDTNELGKVTQYAYTSLGWKTDEVIVGMSTNSFTYNAEGDLLSLSDGKSQLTQWGYDVFGRVTNKVAAASTNSILTYAYYPNGALSNRWTAAKGNTVSGTWGNHDFYHADGNGNITMMLDSNQATVATYKYDPYGNSFTASGALASANLYRFSSKLWCANAGLYYYGYRFYDPTLQRWLNRDPLGDTAFRKINRIPSNRKKTEKNLYHFLFNSPNGSIDQYGLDNTPWPFNATVCSCSEKAGTVCVLIDGEYFTLPPGECTGPGVDADGYWSNEEFFATTWGNHNACEPDDDCRWNGDQEHPANPDAAHPGSPAGRGARIGNAYPDGCGPVYRQPPIPPMRIPALPLGY